MKNYLLLILSLLLMACSGDTSEESASEGAEALPLGFSAGVAVRIKMFEISYSRSRSNITVSPNYFTVTMDLNKF